MGARCTGRIRKHGALGLQRREVWAEPLHHLVRRASMAVEPGASRGPVVGELRQAHGAARLEDREKIPELAVDVGLLRKEMEDGSIDPDSSLRRVRGHGRGDVVAMQVSLAPP